MTERTVLVANRGEIAIRIFRSARALGMRTVAVYSEADEASPHVRAADLAVPIGPAPAPESYLRRDAIIDAARATGAGLVHPGYGFLAEDDRFAAECERAGLVFVGPPSRVLRVVGDKAAARGLAHEADVPTFPGYAGDERSPDTLHEHAGRIGYPLMVKPAGGGGGKGMSVVHDAAGLIEAIDAARRVASAAFDDDRVLLERYVPSPRHVEVQVLADTHGNVIHLGERDCSLQRRHQKIWEEAPAPNLDADVRSALQSAAVAFARRAGYVGAGTCEFLVAADGEIGFIEMNARLQVEHPVTESVTGLDLVAMQLRVALGEPLPVAQADVRPVGSAIEVRVYAEDPRNAFVPQAGRVEHVRWPEGVRVDTWIEPGVEVSVHYDPLLAKIVVHGPDRPAALRALDDALAKTQILGPRTNLAFLATVARDPVVQQGRVTTDWLEAAGPARFAGDPAPPREALEAAAAAEASRIAALATPDPFAALGAWRFGGAGPTTIVVRAADEETVVRVPPGAAVPPAVLVDGTWLVWAAGDQHEIGVGPVPRRIAGAGPAHLDSPLPGRVVGVRVAAGDAVAAGDELVVVEAMKMEHAIRAPADGRITAVLCATGDQVDRGQTLVDFEPG